MDFSLLLGVHNIDEALRDRVSIVHTRAVSSGTEISSPRAKLK